MPDLAAARAVALDRIAAREARPSAFDRQVRDCAELAWRGHRSAPDPALEPGLPAAPQAGWREDAWNPTSAAGERP